MPKDQSIETLRGIAIISIVAFHTIGGGSTDGLALAGDSLWHYFNYSFKYLRLPLFSALSGFVYALKPVRRDDVLQFLKGKSRRILLPFVSVATVQYLANALSPHVNKTVRLDDIWRIYLFPYGQFWFLQALFLVFLMVAILEFREITTYFKGWGLSFCTALVILMVASPACQCRLFAFKGSLYLLPFFLLGMGMQRFHHKILLKPVLLSLALLFIAGIVLQQLNWFGLVDLERQRHGWLGVMVGVSGICLLFYLRKPISWLAKIGYFAYGIFLFHIFGTAGSRILLRSMGVENNMVLFMSGVVAGVGIPIIIEVMVRHHPAARRLLLGLR